MNYPTLDKDFHASKIFQTSQCLRQTNFTTTHSQHSIRMWVRFIFATQMRNTQPFLTVKNACTGHFELYYQTPWRQKSVKQDTKLILGNKTTACKQSAPHLHRQLHQQSALKLLSLSDSTFIHSCNQTCRPACQSQKKTHTEVLTVQLRNSGRNPQRHFVTLLYCITSSHAFSS